MDGAIHSESEDERPLVRTGPIELRDLGPNGRPLGTHDDIYEDSPWELHRGELVERPRAHDIDALAITIAGTLFSTHARAGYTALTDIDGLSSFPTNAFFDQTESSKYIDQWVEGKGRERGRADGVAQSLMAALGVRGLDFRRPYATASRRVAMSIRCSVGSRWR